MHGVACIVAATMLTACSERPANDREANFRSRPHVQSTPELLACANVVDRHVASVKGWPEADYKVEPFRSAEIRGASFLVSHVDDYRGPAVPGAGASVVIEVDCDAGQVLRELRFQ